MFEQIAVTLFYEKAGKSHRAFRRLIILLVLGLMLHFRLVNIAGAVVWMIALAAGEAATSAWYSRVFNRAETPEAQRSAMRQIVLIAGLLVSVYAAPFLWTAERGPLGAAVGAVMCGGILLVVAGQHHLTRAMFYSSSVVPGVALALNVMNLAGSAERPALALLTASVLLSARNLQHVNADTFKSLVESKLDAERTNARLSLALAAAEGASRAKSTFLATMSHELRTPLNGVIGMADALAMSQFDAPHAQNVEIIRRSGQALLAILNDVLDLSKIEAGRLELDLVDFDLAHMIDDVEALFRPAAAQKGLTLDSSLAATAAFYRGDVSRLRQVLCNLVSNAVKFTERGGVRIEAEANAAGHLRIAVADSGPGLAPDSLETVFQPFTQADGSITRRFGGTGLGLSICRDLAHLMGGEVAVTSRLGEGSTFTLTLPLSPTAATVASGPGPDRTPAASFPERLRVLCAEDNPTNRIVLRTLLEHLGCEVSLVDDGREALQAWRREDFDVVLMDVRMPVMDGLAAMRAIRSEEATSGRARTPVVALTADAMEDQIAEQAAAGADLHLSKPIEATSLARALTRALANGASSERAARRA